MGFFNKQVSSETLFIGSGQSGSTFMEAIIEKYGENIPKDNVILFNTNDDTKNPSVIKLKNNGNFDGSGRDVRLVLENIVTQNKDLFEKVIISRIKPHIKQIILLNSLGGASGSSINYWIVKNILIPYKETTRDINIVVVAVLPDQSEGNPTVSNSFYMLRQYFDISSKVSILPIENGVVYRAPKNGGSTFSATNDFIVETVSKIIDYTTFIGEYKKGGLNTLDKQEYNRVMSPADGFLGYAELQPQDVEKGIVKCSVNNFNIHSAKKLVIMFRTPEGKSVNMDTMNKISALFPEQVKIFAESKSTDGRNTIELLVNGINLPDYVEINLQITMNKVGKLKQNKSEDKVKNKEKLSKIGGGLLDL